MEVKVEIETLVRLGIRIEDYFLLFTKYHNIQNSSLITFNTEILNRLNSGGLITIHNAISLEYSLTPKAIGLFQENPLIHLWEEFKKSYPKRTGTGRVLHLNPKACKEKYLKLVAKKGEHEKILKGLESEKNRREFAIVNRQFFPEWKNMATWLNQRQWEAYLEEDNNGQDRAEFGKSI